MYVYIFSAILNDKNVPFVCIMQKTVKNLMKKKKKMLNDEKENHIKTDLDGVDKSEQNQLRFCNVFSAYDPKVVTNV